MTTPPTTASPPTTPPPADAAAWRWEERRTAGGVLLRGAVPEHARHEPLLLVHGLAGGSWYWARWQRFLAERGWPAWALDLRGRPESRAVPDIGPVALADYVED